MEFVVVVVMMRVCVCAFWWCYGVGGGVYASLFDQYCNLILDQYSCPEETGLNINTNWPFA